MSCNYDISRNYDKNTIIKKIQIMTKSQKYESHNYDIQSRNYYKN